MLLVEASNSPDSGRFFYHARSLEKFCSENGIRLSMTNGISGTNKTGPGFLTPFTSPMFTGSFPSSPLLYSPDLGPLRAARIDLVPPLSLDGSQPGKTIASPPESPAKCRQLPLPILSLHDKLKSSPQVGIVHLALQNDNCGSILRFIFTDLLFPVLQYPILSPESFPPGVTILSFIPKTPIFMQLAE